MHQQERPQSTRLPFFWGTSTPTGALASSREWALVAAATNDESESVHNSSAARSSSSMAARLDHTEMPRLYNEHMQPRAYFEHRPRETLQCSCELEVSVVVLMIMCVHTSTIAIKQRFGDAVSRVVACIRSSTSFDGKNTTADNPLMR